ncbi:MAG: sulfatase, partial [Propionibacteriaceae bacterium]|nr:sulfatase [Propionibacteriaceae bacterium]
PLKDTIADDTPVREAALFGIHGGHVNVTDGRYVYMRAWPGEENTPLYNYTLMPTHMTAIFSVEELQQATLAPPFSFTKGMPLLKIPAGFWRTKYPFETMLFDLEADPEQKTPIDAPDVEARMIEHMVTLMKWNDSPDEQYERLGLTAPA